MIVLDDTFEINKKITKVIITERDTFRCLEAFTDAAESVFHIKWSDDKQIKLSLVESDDEER